MTRHALTLTALGAALLAMAATPAFAQAVEIENFIGTVEVVPGSKLRVDGATDVSFAGGDVRIDGGEKLRRTNCNSRNGVVTIKQGRTKRKLTDYPTLRIEAPSDATLVIRDSLVFGTASDLGAADIALSSCGRLEMSDVSGPLKVRLSGSADVSAGEVGEAELRTSGSGDFALRSVRGTAVLATSGSGDFAVGRIGDGLDFRSTGSGDLEIGELMGDAKITLTGSGDVTVDDGRVPTLAVRTTGSGDVTVGGEVGNIDAVTTGSGDIVAARHTGTVKARKTGSGDVIAGGVEVR